MNPVAGTTKRIILPNVRIGDQPLSTVEPGDFVRVTIQTPSGVQVSQWTMAHLAGTPCDWFVDVPMPTQPGRYHLIFTVKADDADDETEMRIEVDPRKVPVA
jgi:uncharacterized membrane protein